MKKLTWLLFLLLGLNILHAQQPTANEQTTPASYFDTVKCSLKGMTTKPVSTNYKVGEPITLILYLDTPDPTIPEGYTINWTRRGDDGKVEKGSSDVRHGAIIRTSLSKPGFIHIQATVQDANGEKVSSKIKNSLFFEGGAGADITKIPCAPEPEDFVEFWNRQRQRLAEVPLQPVLTPIPCKNDKFKLYAVSIPCPGPHNRPCTGYLSIPSNATEKSLPAVLNVHGYTTHTQGTPTNGYGQKIFFDMNAHGYDLGKDEDYYKEFVNSIRPNGQGYAFDKTENSNPETAYFNGMALRVMRALEFLKSLPEWDGVNLIAQGGSQGGLQSVWAAALEPQLTQAFPSIPWCCDLEGVEQFKRIHGTWRIQGTPALRYYDPVNMARHIPKTCVVSIPRAGLGDYVCPPSGVALLYNNIPGPKKIHWVQGSTHGFVPSEPNQAFDFEAKSEK